MDASRGKDAAPRRRVPDGEMDALSRKVEEQGKQLERIAARLQELRNSIEWERGWRILEQGKSG